MRLEIALKKLLGRYIARTKRAERTGQHEQAQRYEHRRDVVSRLIGHRATEAARRRERAWRDNERNTARRRASEE